MINSQLARGNKSIRTWFFIPPAGLCQQKSEEVDRPQWSTFSHVNYSGSLSSTFGSKVSNNCDDSVLDTSELEKVSLEATVLIVILIKAIKHLVTSWSWTYNCQ